MILQIITALGTVAAAASVITAFILYRMQKRDEYIGKVKYSLQYLKSSMEELNSLLNFELAFEIASSALFSIENQPSWKGIHSICNNAIKNNHSEESVKKTMQNRLGVFAFSFQTKLVVEYNKIISNVLQNSTVFHPEFQGLFRLSRACSFIMRNVLNAYKCASMNKELLCDVIYGQIIKKKLVIESYEDFQKEILNSYISILETIRTEHHQKDVDRISEIVEMIYNGHISLSSKKLDKIAKKTKHLKLEDSRNIDTITGELREAEKCFRAVISIDESMKYASLVQSIEDSNS